MISKSITMITNSGIWGCLQAILLKFPAPKDTSEYKPPLESKPPNMMAHGNAQAPPLKWNLSLDRVIAHPKAVE